MRPRPSGRARLGNFMKLSSHDPFSTNFPRAYLLFCLVGSCNLDIAPIRRSVPGIMATSERLTDRQFARIARPGRTAALPDPQGDWGLQPVDALHRPAQEPSGNAPQPCLSISKNWRRGLDRDHSGRQVRQPDPAARRAARLPLARLSKICPEAEFHLQNKFASLSIR